jgi:hypothetical protein
MITLTSGIDAPPADGEACSAACAWGDQRVIIIDEIAHAPRPLVEQHNGRVLRAMKPAV